MEALRNIRKTQTYDQLCHKCNLHFTSFLPAIFLEWSKFSEGKPCKAIWRDSSALRPYQREDLYGGENMRETVQEGPPPTHARIHSREITHKEITTETPHVKHYFPHHYFVHHGMVFFQTFL